MSATSLPIRVPQFISLRDIARAAGVNYRRLRYCAQRDRVLPEGGVVGGVHLFSHGQAERLIRAFFEQRRRGRPSGRPGRRADTE